MPFDPLQVAVGDSPPLWHQLNRPVRWRAAGMLPAACTQVDGRWSGLAALTPEPGKDGGEGRVAMVAHQQADRDDGLTPAACQLKPALWPIRQVMRYAKGRRMHCRMIERERIGNKGGWMQRRVIIARDAISGWVIGLIPDSGGRTGGRSAPASIEGEGGLATLAVIPNS
jgi:hypothetical protein